MSLLLGVPPALIARLTGRSLDTARRWKKSGRLPPAAARLLELKLTGELGFVDAAWHGFRLVRGHLVTPDGTTLLPGEIRAVPFNRMRIAELERLALEPRQYQLLIDD